MDLNDKSALVLDWVRTQPIIAYDVETSGLDWKRNSPVGYVFTVAEDSIYIPVRHGGGGNLLDPDVPALKTPTDVPVQHWFERKLALAFEERNRRDYLTVGHHIGFDALFSAKMGIMLGRNLYDTQHMATLLNEWQEKFSLDFTAVVFGATLKLAQPMYDHLAKLFGGAAKKDQMAHFWRTAGNDPMVVDYAAGDGVTTLEIYHKQLPHLALEKLEKIADIENRLIWTLVRMERRGIKVAIDRFDEAIAKAEALLVDAKSKLPYGFNVRSPAAVRALSERAGKTDWPTTEPSLRFPQGQPSFGEGWLKTFEEGRAVLRVRQIEKLLSSFILPLRDEHTWEGRVHAHLNQLKADEYGTISGRLSCSNPNLQQVLSRDHELAAIYRLLFAADAGMVMYEADYNQAEPRLWAHYSGDKYLNEGYNATPVRDVHAVVALLLNITRQMAKPINLGLFYLMGKKTFHGHMRKDHPEFTRAETDRLWDLWYSNFTDVKRFQKEAASVFKNRGYVKTILGRRARMNDPRKDYVASNRIIQGSSADIIKERLLYIDLRLEAEGDISHLLMTVHDSILFQCPVGDDLTPAWIKAAMEDLNGPPYNLTVPFTVDVTHGLNWAEVKFGKEDE